ncbi:hypothetical protein BDD12DRAFT_537702 [Trichophaea hybrida]|nr:hypothetical protein BDD12DRAFT_537702 [Trichophaea hybrida]
MDSSISAFPGDITTPDVQLDQLLPLPAPSTDRLTQLAPPSSDSLLLTFPAHVRQMELHVRNREPRCWTCTVDRKRCTIEIHEPDQAPCRRCQNLGHSCSNDPKELERRKLTLSKCDGCRERKQKCEFDEPWPEKCRLCKMHNRPCSEPRVAARGRAKLKTDTTAHSAPPPATYSPPATLESHASHISSTVAAPRSSNTANSVPTPPSSLNAIFLHNILLRYSGQVAPRMDLYSSTVHLHMHSIRSGLRICISTVEFTQLQHKQSAPLLPSKKPAYLSADPPQLSGDATGVSNPLRLYQCKDCGRSVRALRRHIQEVHCKNPLIDCPNDGCERKGSNGFKRVDNLRNHLRNVHCILIPKLARGKAKQT